MFKQKMVLEVKGNDERIYKLECEPNSPLGECYDAVCAMRGHLLKQMNENVEKEQQQKDQEKDKKDEVKEVENVE